MTRLIALLCGALLLASCRAAPIAAVPSGNPDPTITVSRIAEFEGVTLYRVDDDGHMVYVAVSSGAARTEWTEGQGKTTVSRETVTVPRQAHTP